MSQDLSPQGDCGAGAAEALYCTVPLIVNARKLMDAGHFAEARALLDQSPDNQKALASELREIMHRIELAYETTPEQLLQKLKAEIPDVTPAELKQWTAGGAAQHRTIDSRIRYFNREPANIYRFCESARARRRTMPPKPPHDLVAHLEQIVKAADATSGELVVPVDHTVEHSIVVSRTAPGFQRGAQVRAWLPYPQELAQQSNVKLIAALPGKYEVAPVGTPQRTIYFESTVSDEEPTFKVKFSFRSFARYPKFADDLAQPTPRGMDLYLAERLPHISFTPQLLATARQIVGDETNPLRKARRIFDFVVQNIAYAAEEEYSTIASISEKALTTHRGDCGVMSLLFITLCRASGIPARWQSGFQTRPGMDDMHDWAEFYVAPFGWLPADTSYGYQESSDPRIRNFYFGHLDSYRMVLNCDYGRPLIPRKSLLRSEPLDFQRGEVELGDQNLYFPHWSWNSDVSTKFSDV